VLQFFDGFVAQDYYLLHRRIRFPRSPGSSVADFSDSFRHKRRGGSSIDVLLIFFPPLIPFFFL